MKIRIEFDGGTSCNIPRLGYGKGYGSYRINDEPVYRCEFNERMSSNAAELRTLTHAIETVKQRYGDGLFIVAIGDSRIALSWAARLFHLGSRPYRVREKTSLEFQDAIVRLKRAVTGLQKLGTCWQPRAKSVATFGH